MLARRTPVAGALIFALMLHVLMLHSAFAQDKRIYLALDDHTDYFWTADGDQYRQAFQDMIDYYLDLADQHRGNAQEYQSRFNCDGSFWLWEYEHHRSPTEFQRLIDAMHSGHFSAPMTALVSCYGGNPAEAVLRGMYYAGDLERRFGLRFRLAVAMENQTLPLGLGALWAGSGARYTWRGICDCATKVEDCWDREHDIYWWVGPDGSRLLTKWNSLLVSNRSMGGYAEARDPFQIVDYVDQDAGFKARYPYPVIGCFGNGWDDFKTFRDDFITAAKQKSNSQRQVIVSNEVDYFEDFLANHAGGIPEESRSYGNEWELLCASMAEVSASVKRVVELLRAAEAMASVVSLEDPSFLEGRTPARQECFKNLGLYWEHDWTADGPVPASKRAKWQRDLLAGMETYVHALHEDARLALGRKIQAPKAAKRFFAFNPLGMRRTDFVDLPYEDPGKPIHVVDVGRDRVVPHQFLTKDGERTLRVLAEDVPSVGYVVFAIRPGPGASFRDVGAFDLEGGVLENDHYRLKIAPRGAIVSLLDKRTNHQYARNDNGKYVNDLGASGGSLHLENAGPVSITVKAVAPDPLAHTTRITLFGHNDRIEIRNEITENFSAVQTWNYSFNLQAPRVHHEEVGAVLLADLTTNGGHYSPRNARYDWLTLNHFLTMTGAGGHAVTLSNADCYFFKLGNSTKDVLDTATARVAPLIGGQVDGSSLGIKNQDGDRYFLQRFALHTHDGASPAAAMRFALEHQNPLVAGMVSGTEPSLPAHRHSLLKVSDPNVLLWSLKPHEDGVQRGLTARLWNLADRPAQRCLLRLPHHDLLEAVRTTHLETDEEPLPVANEHAVLLEFAPEQLRTLRLVPDFPRRLR